MWYRLSNMMKCRVLLDTHVFLWWHRLLAAQALEEDCGIVSADQVFGKYGVKRIW
jgi:PIN domain nuclease of toxin-antitoxin system